MEAQVEGVLQIEELRKLRQGLAQAPLQPAAQHAG